MNDLIKYSFLLSLFFLVTQFSFSQNSFPNNDSNDLNPKERHIQKQKQQKNKAVVANEFHKPNSLKNNKAVLPTERNEKTQVSKRRLENMAPDVRKKILAHPEKYIIEEK